MRKCCCQYVKDKNFESNSQLSSRPLPYAIGCCQYVKDKNFESNSQQRMGVRCKAAVVANTSKIKISKAIHNRYSAPQPCGCVVANTSKIKISKAIHNEMPYAYNLRYVVANTSKIKISKAIHNQAMILLYRLLSCCQYVKDKNFESNSQQMLMDE